MTRRTRLSSRSSVNVRPTLNHPLRCLLAFMATLLQPKDRAHAFLLAVEKAKKELAAKAAGRGPLVSPSQQIPNSSCMMETFAATYHVMINANRVWAPTVLRSLARNKLGNQAFQLDGESRRCGLFGAIGICWVWKDGMAFQGKAIYQIDLIAIASYMSFPSELHP